MFTKLLTFIVVSFVVNAHASDFQIDCFNYETPVKWSYCSHIDSAIDSDDLVYHLHGRGNSELAWQEKWYYPSQIRKEWSKQSISYPMVVSLSFGPLWLLAEKNSSNLSGLLGILTKYVLPKIESQIGKKFKRRIVLGESMGGFNAVQLAFKTNLFSKAAILCSPMSEISPFTTKAKITDHVKKSSAWEYYKDYDPDAVLGSVDRIIQLTKAFYPTQIDWEKADPLKLASKTNNGIPQLYVAVGFYDRYAAYEGNEKFIFLLEKAGRNVEWRPQWGGHCAIDIPSLARFLIN